MSNRVGGRDARTPGSGSTPGNRDAFARPEDANVVSEGDLVAGKYRVQGVLGVGGMGVVVAARHEQLGQRVAIKFMRATTDDATSTERFFREARAVVGLSSEHVAKVLDMGTLENGAPYIVMEFLAGIDLGEALRRHGPMPVPDAVGNVLQACEAIAEAHAIGIVHRDLKPANLFLTTHLDGASFVKVLDFGISKMAQAKAQAQDLTASGAIMGSPGYMSPEQVRNSKDIDLRSDIWAIGVILYEVLAGVSPFHGDTLGEVFAKIVSQTPVPLDRIRPDVPAPLAAVIARCLEREPATRFANLAELASMLLPFGPPEGALSVRRIQRVCEAAGQIRPTGAALAAPPLPSPSASASSDSGHVSSSAPGRGETGRAWLRANASTPGSTRRPRGVFAIVAVGVLLASGVTWLYVQRSRQDPTAIRGTSQVASPPSAESRPLAAAIAASPDAATVETLAPEHDLAVPAASEHGEVPSQTSSATAHASNGHPPPMVQRAHPIVPPAALSPHPPAASAPRPTTQPTPSLPHETDVF